MTIREQIIEYLKDNDRQSIKDISESIKAKENVVRTKIYDKGYGLMAKGKVVKVDHIGRRNYFSLKENTPSGDKKEFENGYFQYSVIYTKLMDHIDRFSSIDKPDLRILASEYLDFELHKKLEKELGI